MDFIGRTSELATLNAELERGSGFVVIYGRRRVGKTTLIKEFIKDKRAFYFLATTESEAQSMKRFAGVLSRTTKNPMLSKVTFTDWLDLFQVVADDHPDEKKVLVIDEFPYLVKTNPDFPSILQNAWDEVLKDHNVMLVLCGSLISMMKKHALAYDSPLYGRRTAQIRLMPLQFTDVYAAQNLSFEQAVEQYAITGGVPKYMEFFQTDEPLVEQIRRVVLSKNGFLYEEPDFLLNEEVQTPINYFSVLKSNLGWQPQAEQNRHDDGAGHFGHYAVPENTDRPWFCYQERSHHRKESRAFPEEPVLCFGQLHPLLVPLCVPVQGRVGTGQPTDRAGRDGQRL